MLRIWCTALVLTSAAACATVEETSTIPKYTGIRIDAAQLFSAVGCGTRDGQAYKYYAIVNETNQSGVFDCYADAVFQVAAGNYTLALRSFDEKHWTAAASAGVAPDRADALFKADCTAIAWDRATATARCSTTAASDAGAPDSSVADAADAVAPPDADIVADAPAD